MYLRASYLEVFDSEDNDQATRNFDDFLDHARDRKHAWFTGFAVGMDMDEAIVMADDRGYSLWAPEITANEVTRRCNVFVGVRNDLVSGEMSKFFELGQLGMGQTEDPESEAFADPNGFVSVAFDTTVDGLGHVSVGCAPYLSDELRVKVLDWLDENSQETNLAFFGSYATGVPLVKSVAGRVRSMTSSSQLQLQGHHVYVESTYTVRSA